jgi:hypothetical protein
VTPEEGGDKRQIAVNEAYRDAQAWWVADRTGVAIERQSPRENNGRTYDVLAVSPIGGKTFEAWFDSDSHLLARVVEMQGIQRIATIFSDYRANGGLMIANNVVIDDGSGAQNLQTETLVSASFQPPRPHSFFHKDAALPDDATIQQGAARAIVPFRLLNNHIYIRISVNDQGPFLFIVDTGGHDLLTPHTAKLLGLRVQRQTPSQGAGQKTVVSGYAHVNEIKLGEAVLRNQEVFVLDFQPAAVDGVRADGMLGFEVFRRFVSQVDYQRHTLTLMQAGAFRPSPGAVAVPFVFYDQLPQVNGSFEGVQGRFDIDTGSRVEVTLTKPFVDRYSLRARDPGGVVAVDGWGVGGPVQSYVARASEMRLGSVVIPDIGASLAIREGGSFADNNYAGNVGSALLKRFNVTFDYFQRIVHFERPSAPAPDTSAFDRSGMWINARDRCFQIMDITPGGPAAEAGLKVGDQIIAIDGIPVKAIELSDFRAKLRDENPGTVVNLMARDAKGVRRVPLKLRSQI